MKKEIKVPPVGESITQGVVGKILKPEGSFTKVDEELLEIETDKVNQPIYALNEGVVHWTIKEGDLVEIGQNIGYIDEKEAPLNAAPAPSSQKETPPPVSAPVPPSLPSSRPPKSPVRKSIEESLHGKETPSPSSPPIKAPIEQTSVSRTPMSSLRKTIADRLVKAKNQTAMLTTFNEVDVTNILKIREKEQELFTKRYGVKLGFMSFFIKAVVSALKEFPQVGAWIEQDHIITSQKYDICIAVSTEKGLVVPVVRDCDQKSFGALEQEVSRFAKKAREGKISLEEMRGGIFTITNGGVFGSMLSTPILNPPQSAILGMHTIVKRAVVHQDQIVIRPIMYLALSYDHRIVDGKEAIGFLVHIKQNLEEPTRMLLEGPGIL